MKAAKSPLLKNDCRKPNFPPSGVVVYDTGLAWRKFTAALPGADGGRRGEGGEKEMAQGQKQSRFIAWTFMDDDQRRRFITRKR